MRQARKILGGLVAVAVATLCAAPAPASTVEVLVLSPGYSQVTMIADLGETNTVTVAGDANDGLILADATSPITAAAGCEQLDPNRARCVDAAAVSAQLGDLDDTLTVEDSAYAPLVQPNSVPFVLASGGPGEDRLTGAAGQDSFNGGLGDDTLDGRAGNDFLSAGDYEESACLPSEGGPVSEADGNDVLEGGPGDDSLVSSSGTDVLIGGAGNDDLSAGQGTDPHRIEGGDGDDSLEGGAGDERLDGGAGNDTLAGGPGDDELIGGDGADRLETTFIFFFGPNVPTGPCATAGNDRVDGGPGDDTFEGGPPEGDGADRFTGGEGTDAVNYGQRLSALVVSLDGVPDDGLPGEGDNVAADVENVQGGSDADSLIGNDAANALDGRQGDDLVDGRGGNDVLEGGVNDGGSDTLAGGAGDDVLRGSAGDDSLDGGDGGDRLAAGGGSDTLTGADGFDDLAGGPGQDSVSGGAGNDTLRGGDAVLVGADSNDVIDGGDGDDVVLGGPGNDAMDGGLGADTLNGEVGRDTVSYEARGVDVGVTLDGERNDGAAGERDLVASDVEAITGGAVDDTLSGDVQGNGLDGGSGEDYVDGGRGRDTLTGGNARDAVRSRDGVPDLVACGEDVDFAIADAVDTVRDCERVDVGGPHKLRPGGGVEVNPSRGTLRLQIAGTGRSIPLQDSIVIPGASSVDATAGTVRLASAATRGGRRQSGTFYEGRFAVRERGARRRVTELSLQGGDFASCPTGAALARASQASKKRKVRHLWGRAGKKRGRFRTRGRWSTATVRGTVWLTEDRCDGTLTRVVEGTVVVHDLVKDVEVTVRAGDSYLARAPQAARSRRASVG